MSDLSQWPALVLTAGLATRLRPLSAVRAKAAMPVGGRAIIERILHWLQQAGIERVVVNLHHRPETITAIVGDGSQYGLRVRYSWEREILGSAGGPRRALPLLEADRFLIINGDTLTDCDLGTLAARHAGGRARVTMAVAPGDVQRYGGVLVDRDGHVRGFGRPHAMTTAYHFIGVQAVNADAFAALPDDQPSESVKTLYPQLLAADRDAIAVWPTDAEFLDVGTPRDYLETIARITARERRPFDVGDHCRIAPDATVERSVLWNRVVVGPGAHVVNSILGDDVVIAANATVENMVMTAADGERAL